MEANYPPVYYVPREDIAEEFFARTDHTSYCPYKGDASYFSLQIPGHAGANAVWSYEDPKVSVEQIKNYVAFYPYQVTFEILKYVELWSIHGMCQLAVFLIVYIYIHAETAADGSALPAGHFRKARK
ncbi:hypothetical protein PS934_05923 [Pseudomonas fluorescens]|nr:hypothetical protein PS934_05923 [Pseudomonas fluorescens]